MPDLSAWVCQHLARIDDTARLAWVGRPSKFDGETDPGDFAIVQLWPSRMVGPVDNPYTNNEWWDLGWQVNKFGKLERCRKPRGRLYDRNGGLTRDYDQVGMIPIYIAKFVDYGLPNWTIPHGGFTDMVRSWKTSMTQRIRESARARGKLAEEQIKDVAGAGTDYLWSLANKSDAGGIRTSTREERVAAHRAIVEQEEETSLADYFEQKKVFKPK